VLVVHPNKLCLNSVKLEAGLRLEKFCDVSQIIHLSEKMGKTRTNVERIGAQLTRLRFLTLTNLLFYGDHLFVRKMLPAKTNLLSLTIIAEKRKSSMAYQCKSGEDFEVPSISNIINKEFTQFVKLTTIRLKDDWLHLDLRLDGDGFKQISPDHFYE